MFIKRCFFIFLYLFSFHVSAIDDKLDPISHISVPDGLSDNSVTCMLEDSRGFMWFGTFNGLNRYDGYEIKKYRNSTDKKILVSNRIRSLREDSNGFIWIGTDNGITIYNPSLEKFTALYSNQLKNKLDKGPGVLKIVEDKKNNKIYCMTWQEGVLVFNSDFRFLDKYSFPKMISSESILLTDMALLDSENLLLTSNAGLLHFNTNKNKYTIVENPVFKDARSLEIFDNDKLIFTLAKGVAVYSYHVLEDKLYYSNLFLGYKKIRFNTANVDKDGNLWLGHVANGIFLVDNIFKLIHHKETETSRFEIASEQCHITTVLITENKGTWAGSFDRGIFKFKSKKSPFKQMSTEGVSSEDVNAYRVMNITQLDDDKAYVVARNGRVDLIDTRTGKNTPFIQKFKKINKSNVIKIFVDSKKNTWIWYNDKSLYKMDGETEEVSKIEDEKLANLVSFRSIKEDQFGEIWIHSVNAVFRLKFDENGTYVGSEELTENAFFIKDKLYYVRDFYVDPIHNYLWLGTIHDGLYRVEIEKNKSLKELEITQSLSDVTLDSSLPNNYVSAIKRGPDNILWIGTVGGGVSKVLEDDKKLKFVSYTEKEGLSNNNVQDIFIDKKNNLWVATNYGLNKFDPKDVNFAKFYKEDGLPFEEFRDVNTFFDNGTLLLSGYRDYFYFKTEDLELFKPLPQLSFGNLKILNKNINPKEVLENRVVLESSLDNVEKLVLKYDENIFSIDLISLHFSNPKKYYLKYQLLPSNSEWIQVPSGQKTINYSSLPSGEYVLKVMASNSLNNWTKPKELKIVILQPWWNTTLARIVYILLIVLVVYGVVNYRLRYIHLEHDLEIQQFEKDKVNEISAAKLRYFSDISHEIKTPLTLISGPVSILAEKFSKKTDIYGHLEMIQRQTKKIIQLVNQVHDFQKSDANALKLNKSHFYVHQLIDEIQKDYQIHVVNHNKKLEVNAPEKPVYVFADYDKLEKTLNNLLSNSFKFTESGDVVTIEYKNEGNNLVVTVKDSGKGIDAEDLPFIFDRFYHSNKQNSFGVGGSGIGLAFSKRLVEMHYGTISAESELSVGTKISITMPIVIEGFEENQIEKEKELLSLEEKYTKEDFVPTQNEIENVKIASELRGTNIFLAEDNDDMRLFISNALGAYFNITSFSNGKACLEALDNEWPDLIISDVLMPEMNGFELCRSVKTDINTSHIPVVLLTALAEVDEQVKGLMDGADSYITKPFDMKLLISKIESILQSRKLLRERFEINLPLTRKKDEIVSTDITFLEKLYALMEENIDNQEVDINSFAKELFLSRTHFFQKVKALTDQTPYSLLKTYRLKKAASMLVQQNMSVNEVFLSTGFKNRPHFNKAFKEYFRVSPSTYVSDNGVK